MGEMNRELFSHLLDLLVLSARCGDYEGEAHARALLLKGKEKEPETAQDDYVWHFGRPGETIPSPPPPKQAEVRFLDQIWVFNGDREEPTSSTKPEGPIPPAEPNVVVSQTSNELREARAHAIEIALRSGSMGTNLIKDAAEIADWLLTGKRGMEADCAKDGAPSLAQCPNLSEEELQAIRLAALYEVQEIPDESVTLDSGSIKNPLVTLKNGCGGISHIIMDDHCYVLVNGSDNRPCRMACYWYPEAAKALAKLFT